MEENTESRFLLTYPENAIHLLALGVILFKLLY